MNNKSEKVLHIDMDGTLVVFNPLATMDELLQEGYFLNLKPLGNVIEGIKTFIKRHPDVKVKTLSCYLEESEYALEEKKKYIEKYLPEISKENRIFIPCGKSKHDFIETGKENYLLDDCSVNLFGWSKRGIGIKLMNGINGTKGTWQGFKISHELTPDEFADNLYLLIYE